MKFLVDECTGPAVARWLRSMGYEAFSVFDESRGASDDEILTKAYSENWILITNDKDFGEMVYRENRSHCGIVFLRLRDQRSTLKIDALSRLIFTYIEQLPNAFVVVTETQVRFTNLQNPSL
jgi:predicted nuclease of predicted toxin-antitoxin system